jgi:hypothetical protein
MFNYLGLPRSRAACVAAAMFLVVALMAGTTPPAVAQVPSTSDADPAVLVRGTLRNQSGAAIPGKVTALAWPDDASMSAMELATAVKLTPVASADVGRDGIFELRLGSDVPLSALLDPQYSDAALNVTVLGQSGDETAVFDTFRRYGVDVRDPSLPLRVEDLVALDGVPVIDLRLGLGNSTEVTEGEEVAHEEGVVESETPAATPLAPIVVKSCDVRLIERYRPTWGAIAETHTGPGSVATVTYTRGASSGLGVALSSGSNGPWRVGGKQSRSSEDVVRYPRAAANTRRVYDTGWQQGKYFVTCSGHRPYWQVRTIKWVGGTRTRAMSTEPPRNHCVTYQAGSGLTQNRAQAVTFTGGLQTSGIIGINLSAQTGFNVRTSIGHDFSRTSVMCGSNDFPPRAARVSVR